MHPVLLWATMFLCSVAVAAGSNTAQNYKLAGKVPGDGKIKTKLYDFDVIAPEYLGDYGWDRYADQSDKRNTVLRAGLDGVMTYALTVLNKGAAAPQLDAAGFAKTLYPNAVFVAVAANPDCAMMPLDTPLGPSGGMFLFLAECIDQKSRQGYELSISSRSPSFSSPGKKRMIGRGCTGTDADLQEPPPPDCRDQFDWLRNSFKVFVESFKFASRR